MTPPQEREAAASENLDEGSEHVTPPPPQGAVEEPKLDDGSDHESEHLNYVIEQEEEEEPVAINVEDNNNNNNLKAQAKDARLNDGSDHESEHLNDDDDGEIEQEEEEEPVATNVEDDDNSNNLKAMIKNLITPTLVRCLLQVSDFCIYLGAVGGLAAFLAAFITTISSRQPPPPNNLVSSSRQQQPPPNNNNNDVLLLSEPRSPALGYNVEYSHHLLLLGGIPPYTSSSLRSSCNVSISSEHADEVLRVWDLAVEAGRVDDERCLFALIAALEGV